MCESSTFNKVYNGVMGAKDMASEVDKLCARINDQKLSSETAVTDFILKDTESVDKPLIRFLAFHSYYRRSKKSVIKAIKCLNLLRDSAQVRECIDFIFEEMKSGHSWTGDPFLLLQLLDTVPNLSKRVVRYATDSIRKDNGVNEALRTMFNTAVPLLTALRFQDFHLVERLTALDNVRKNLIEGKRKREENVRDLVAAIKLFNKERAGVLTDKERSLLINKYSSDTKARKKYTLEGYLVAFLSAKAAKATADLESRYSEHINQTVLDDVKTQGSLLSQSISSGLSKEVAKLLESDGVPSGPVDDEMVEEFIDGDNEAEIDAIARSISCDE
jgi:hypothetical protein